ncbi:MAG: hypothetical protein Q4G45_00620 [Actinomycetia bacterium]|nr:hypothetical protein [Actinomycetes bacterium]
MVSLAETAGRYRQIIRYQRETVLGPARVEDVEAARAFVRRLRGAEVPEEIVELWSVSAVVDFSGGAIFAPRAGYEPLPHTGLVEENLRCDPPAGFLHVGTIGDEWLSWCVEDGAYYQIDKVSWSPLYTHARFEEMFYEHIGDGIEKVYEYYRQRGEL